MQSTVSVASPSQSVPPLLGAGLSQARVLALVPMPQVTEQGPSVHIDHIPFTGAEDNYCISTEQKGSALIGNITWTLGLLERMINPHEMHDIF